MYDDPACDEYLYTGVDPTGGGLGPDFNPETGQFLNPMDEENLYDDVSEENVDEDNVEYVRLEGIDAIIDYLQDYTQELREFRKQLKNVNKL